MKKIIITSISCLCVFLMFCMLYGVLLQFNIVSSSDHFLQNINRNTEAKTIMIAMFIASVIASVLYSSVMVQVFKNKARA